MLELKNFLFQMIFMALNVYKFVFFGYILAGWFVQNRYVSWYVFLGALYEPPLAFLRRITRNKLRIDMLDLTPLLLFFSIEIAQRLLAWIFYY